MIAGIDEMLSKGISFSLYMTHGGTNWGHWAGANSPGFAPDVTSYDYDAPISESGQTTPKYWELRKTLAQKLSRGAALAALDIVREPAERLKTAPRARAADIPPPELEVHLAEGVEDERRNRVAA